MADFQVEQVPLYAVLFNMEDTSDRLQDPLASAPQATENATIPHNLDREVVDALAALWYVLHLPSTISELTDIPITGLKRRQQLDLSHHIFLAPVHSFTAESFTGRSPQYLPLIVFCPDDKLEDVSVASRRLGFALGAVPYSQMSNDELPRLWRAIHDIILPGKEFFAAPITLTSRLDLAASSLPYKILARQMGRSPLDTEPDDLDGLLEGAFDLQLLLSTLARMEGEGLDRAQAAESLPAALAEEAPRLRFPLSLSLPGVPSAYSRRAYHQSDQHHIERLEATDSRDSWSLEIAKRSDGLIERNAIEFIVAHGAIGRSGIGLALPSAPQALFTHLRQLAQHFDGRPVGPTVWRLLRRLDAASQPLWTEAVRGITARATMLNVYSNFPLGLLTLPGDTSPLLTRIPITYRPLLPLTRALQSELQWEPPLELHEGFKVLIAECIPDSDPVGRLSRAGWSVTSEIVAESPAPIDLKIVYTSSILELRRAIEEHSPDILVISAHGAFDNSANVAGLVVGSDFVLGPGLGPLPPVVILSACHVAPRGAGTVNIADLLIREGAVAVLGTQVPVDVRHNALLMGRLFVYMSEILNRRERYPTLLAAWHHVQRSNAVIDILDGSEALRNWGYRSRRGRLPVLQEFMLARSRGRLRAGRIYEDTETVLGEMADDDGLGQRVRNWFKTPGYVPESLFYVMIGRPERIYLRPFNSAVVEDGGPDDSERAKSGVARGSHDDLSEADWPGVLRQEPRD